MSNVAFASFLLFALEGSLDSTLASWQKGLVKLNSHKAIGFVRLLDADSLEVNFVSGVGTTAQHRWHCVVKKVADFCFLNMLEFQLEF